MPTSQWAEIGHIWVGIGCYDRYIDALIIFDPAYLNPADCVIDHAQSIRQTNSYQFNPCNRFEFRLDLRKQIQR